MLLIFFTIWIVCVVIAVKKAKRNLADKQARHKPISVLDVKLATERSVAKKKALRAANKTLLN